MLLEHYALSARLPAISERHGTRYINVLQTEHECIIASSVPLCLLDSNGKT